MHTHARLSAPPPCSSILPAAPAPALVLVGPCSAPPSPLQIISQGQAKAESINLELGLQIKHMLLVELAAFLKRWVCVLVCTGGGPCSHLSQVQHPSFVPQVGIQARSAPAPCPYSVCHYEQESSPPCTTHPGTR